MKAFSTFGLLGFCCVLGGGGGLVGCGGSASETPWPVEPDNVDLGPSGENRRDDGSVQPKAAPGETSQPADAPPKKAEPAGPLF